MIFSSGTCLRALTALLIVPSLHGFRPILFTFPPEISEPEK